MARILILEDHFIQAADTERILLHAGHDVVGLAPLTQIALEIAKVRPPELLICDLQLALDLDGMKGAAEMNRLYGCKVLIVTGYPEAVTSEIEVKPCGVLRKPHSEKMLLEAVVACLKD
jgi:DNA-binding NtrC family response regulator